MKYPEWKPNMTDAQYLAYVLGCAYLGIKPKPRY